MDWIERMDRTNENLGPSTLTLNYLVDYNTENGPMARLYYNAEFLADRTNGRAYATVLRVSVCRLSSVTLCIVAKRCVLEQKLLLRAYRKSYMRNRLIPK